MLETQYSYPQAVTHFAHEAFEQEFPYKYYIQIDKTSQMQPTSLKWLGKYALELSDQEIKNLDIEEISKQWFHQTNHPTTKFFKTHMHPFLYNFTNPQVVDAYIQVHFQDYARLMNQLDGND